MFIPGSTDPADLDQAMRSGLADSLEHIHSAVGGLLDLPAAELSTATAAVRAHRVAPGVFGRYCKLVMAVERRHDAQAAALFREITELARQVPEFGAALYTEAALGAERDVYGALLEPPGSGSPWIVAPRAAEDFPTRVDDALALIAIADPALADEIRGLVVQVVGAAPSRAPGVMSFGSASSMMLWGLTVVNTERYASAADLVQGLVHEAGHLMLYAHSIDEPLATNPIGERYLSPLREDPRPMDGIIHATFVSARLHYLNARLRQATDAHFAPVPLEELDSRLVMLRDFYFGGLGTVREHGQLTPTGRRVLEESLDYMNAA
jgi:HEXXH motif-containing protein